MNGTPGGETPRLRLLPGGGDTEPAGDLAIAHIPISIVLSGRREVDIFQAAIEDQRVNPTRGVTALDRLLAALETVFEAVKAGAPESRPPVVVAKPASYLGGPGASAVVVVEPEPDPPPPPRCG